MGGVVVLGGVSLFLLIGATAAAAIGFWVAALAMVLLIIALWWLWVRFG